MTSIVNNSLTKVAALVVAVSLVAGFAFTFTASRAEAATLSAAQISSIISLLQSFGADASTIANVSASLNGTAPTGGSTGGTTTSGPCAFTKDLTIGSKGADVTCLQNALIAAGHSLPAGATGYFGTQTQAAVMAWQKAAGVSPAAGYFGAKSRAAFGGTSGTTGGTTPTPSGVGISVSGGTQPMNSLAPKGAARVPFTNFTLTNNSGSAVTVNGVTVERGGLAQDAAFSGVVLIDKSNNTQLGTSKTLNSNHQAILGDTFTLNAGESRTFVVAGNMASSLTSYTGQVGSFSVVAVNTTATVSGSLPIMGASQTLNDTLTIGTVSTSTSSYDPGAAQDRNLGDTAIKFAGIKFTAGSGEDLKLYSIRFRQVGSASSVDLANMNVYVDGTAYPAVVDSTGKYYTASFPSGILIAKGFSSDVYISGDLVGSNSASRTVDFDLDKVTDVYFVGQLYGYGIAPSGTYTPWFNGYVTTIRGASVTTISKANEVAAQNIALNVPNQPLGGYVVDILGEAVTTTSQVFNLNYSSGAASSYLLTSVSLVDENGAVVAGPVDAVAVNGTEQKVTFTDSVTYKTGRHIYTLRGKLPTGVTNGVTLTASTTPSGWSSVTGQTTGNSVTISQGNFSMNAMTVRTAALAVAVSATPAAQNIVAGQQGVLFANFQFDASQSGEDVRFSSLGLTASTSAALGSTTDLTSCQLFDGSTALNTGSNVVNPTITATAFTATAATFTLNAPVTVAKGTVKTLALKCNASSAASGSLKWGITSTQIAAVSVTGVTSSASVTATGSTNNGQLMTIASGAFTVATDASSPSYAIAAAGTNGVTLGVYKFRATTDSVNLNRIGLKLTNTASSTASDLVTVSLWNGSTQIGTATFVGSNTNATSTLATPLVLTKDTDVTVTVKGDLALVGTSQAGVIGHLIAVDADMSTNTQGTGVGSGATINGTGSTAVAGVRLQKSYPTVAKDTLSSTGIGDGILMRFKVTANSKGDVGISKFSLTLATTTATVTGTNIYAYTDAAYSTPVSGVRSDGAMLATDQAGSVWASSSTVIEYYAQTAAAASTTVQVPAGETRYFEVRGSVSGATSGASIITTIQGDAAYPSLATTFIGTAAATDGDTNDDFIWSPNSSATAAVTDSDWTNGYGVAGLPSAGLTNTRGQ